MEKNPLWESVKNVLRSLIFAALAGAVTYLLNVGLKVLIGGLPLPEFLATVIFGTLYEALQGVDKWIHEQGKLEGNSNAGLVKI